MASNLPSVTIPGLKEVFGLPQIILWMITFAVVYGVLSQVGEKGIPQHKGTRGIIAMVIAFLVILSPQSSQLSQMVGMFGSSMLLIVLGLLTLIVFIEAAGIKVHKTHVVEHEGVKRKVPTGEDMSIFEAYSKYFAIALIFIVVMIFVSAGGLSWIGLSGVTGFGNIDVLGSGIIIMIILAVIWMIAESGGGEKKK